MSRAIAKPLSIPALSSPVFPNRVTNLPKKLFMCVLLLIGRYRPTYRPIRSQSLRAEIARAQPALRAEPASRDEPARAEPASSQQPLPSRAPEPRLQRERPPSSQQPALRGSPSSVQQRPHYRRRSVPE